MRLFELDLLIGIVSATAILIIAMVSVALLFRFRVTSEYNDKRQEAVLSETRAYFEKHIALLNERLTLTQDKWRDVNHLLLSAQQAQSTIPRHEHAAVVASQFGVKATAIEPRLVFVLTPFAKEERQTFEQIKRICEAAGFRCLRGDEENATGAILKHVVDIMARARIVIANISSRNANVFYELGLAHAMGKRTILVSKTDSEVPFDLASQRVLFYDDDQGLEAGLRNDLIRLLSNEVDS
jgi:hypothetical protein